MNSLTKVLLEDLLDADNKKVTAIYGGGFKPPTKGHFDVVDKASEQNPEIDDILIYVGGGERDGISQGESIQIWELYKKYLPIKTVIEPANAPVGDILRYAKEHPEETVLWIIGARENNPEDFADIASRTRTLEKYPNLQLRVIQTTGGVSGTAARNAVKDNNKEQFFHLIPDIPEKEQVWDIVSSVVKEEINPSTKLKSNIINEGRYDSISRQLASYTLKGWKDDFEHNEPTGRVEFAVGPDGDLEYEDLKFSYKGVAVFAGIQTYSYNGSAKLTSGEIKITYSIPKSMLPQGWEKIYMDLISVIRHEIEHLTQGGINVKPGKEILDLPLRRLVIKYPDTLRYILLPSEKDANVQGLYLKAKKARRPYAEVVDEYIRDVLKITNKNDVDILKGMYDKRAKELNLPAILENDPFGLNKLSRQFIKEAKQEVKESMVVVLSRKDNQINLYDLKTNEALGVINTYNNEVSGIAAKKGYGPLMYELGMANVYPNGLQSDRHGNTEPAAEEVWKKYIAGASPNIKVQKLTPEDKDYRTTYAGDGYDSSYIPDFYNYKFYNPDTATLKQLIQKGNTLSDELKKQIVLDSDKLYSNMVRESNSKDPFGLNELARQFIKEALIETWNPKESFVSLSKYMIDNGMNIKPLPKIKIISNDEENASNLLGKTAYYNPNDKSITLYTKDRHPKDICRSFTHEMVHHEQNLEGRLNNINTTNTNEDGALPEIEKEAYEKGNMMLRNWEDSIKNV